MFERDVRRRVPVESEAVAPGDVHRTRGGRLARAPKGVQVARVGALARAAQAEREGSVEHETMR